MRALMKAAVKAQPYNDPRGRWRRWYQLNRRAQRQCRAYNRGRRNRITVAFRLHADPKAAMRDTRATQQTGVRVVNTMRRLMHVLGIRRMEPNWRFR